MPDDPPVVRRDLDDAVRAIIAHVLMVNIGDVQPDRAIIAELGAESIDFLDLVFRIEDAVGKKIELSEWQEFVSERLPGADLSKAITVALVQEFAQRKAER
jgi:acyl carrier protein